MAEAHSAVAFSFTVTHEGVDVDLNHEALWAVWHSGVRSWKKRIGKAKVGRFSKPGLLKPRWLLSVSKIEF